MNIPLNTRIAALLEKAIRVAQDAGDLPDFVLPYIQVEHPKYMGQGDYASGVSLVMTRLAKRPPLDIAAVILKHIPLAEFIDRFEVVKPGFINMFLAPHWLQMHAARIVLARTLDLMGMSAPESM